jgi:hypothetical protein
MHADGAVRLEREHNGTSRSLLQAKKGNAFLAPVLDQRHSNFLFSFADCPVDFKGANYTAVTSRCKDLVYQLSLCCDLLQEFACPYSGYINDPGTNCAGTMFSYATIYGKYPPGLFRSTCVEGNDGGGLKCSDDVQQPGRQEDLLSAAAAAGIAAPAVAMPLVAAVLFASNWS